MRILELFSGYGTASFALKRLGIDYQIVGYSDIDKYANQCFRQNHKNKLIKTVFDIAFKTEFNYGELGDVREINPNSLMDFDLLTAGFPCQAFSVAGKGLGEIDPRGTLFYEIIRIAEVKKPKYMLLENVKGLTTKKHKPTFDKILSELSRIGYNVYWKVLNSKDYGIPQSRARVWFVCFRKDIDKGTFKFPEPVELKIFIKDILETQLDKKYYLSPLLQERFTKYLEEKEKGGIVQPCVYEAGRKKWRTHEEECPTLKARMGTGGNNVPMILTGLQEHQQIKTDGTCNCLPSAMGEGGGHTPMIYQGQLRRLTPKECFRLMGFLNDEINLDGLSDTQKYKLAGNGQDVNMVSLIFKEMFK